MRKIIIVIIFLSFQSSAYSFQLSEEFQKLEFNAGPGISSNSFEKDARSLESGRLGFNVTTELTYPYRTFEFGLPSMLVFSKYKNVYFANGRDYDEKNSLAFSNTFGVFARHFFGGEARGYTSFVEGGTFYPILTSRITDNTSIGGNDNPSKRITYKGKGFFVGWGIKSKTKTYKLNYYRTRFQNLSILDGSIKNSDVVYSEELDNELIYHSFVFSVIYKIF